MAFIPRRMPRMAPPALMPASHVELRRWTSTEALGDITVHPDCTARIAVSSLPNGQTSDTEEVDGTLDQTDHQLPTMEEKLKAIADRFPAEVIKVDVTGRSFSRMSQCRRSLIHNGTTNTSTTGGDVTEARRRTRPRRHRSRRRNTIAGTDQKEIEEALNGEKPGAADIITTMDDIVLSSSSGVVGSNISSSKSSKDTSAADIKKWAFNSLRRWGKSRLKAMNGTSTATAANAVSGELHTTDPVDDINVYETIAGRRRGPSSSSKIPISAAASGPMSLAVKLREGTLGQRRLKALDEPPHSSSGNWSASSESGRASVNSDSASSHQPKSSTCSSVLPHRRRFVNNSTSSSVTSEGTLTPEDMAALPFLDDGETSSASHPEETQRHSSKDIDKTDVNLSAARKEEVYSCDTEGYYTSFHMDSGLKTLKEEEAPGGFSLPQTPMHSTTALSNCSSGRGSASLAQLTAESEYELFGKGSTSTTASSAGTVCTTLLVDTSKNGNNSNGSNRSLSHAPAVPERKSSLSVPCLAEECPPCSTVVALIHNTNRDRLSRSDPADSPDSGHNTSSSPIDSMSSPQDTETDALVSPIPSISSEMEFSECSDFEGTDRIERMRVKTIINSSCIPSMCVITPPQSDDETSLRQFMVGCGNTSYSMNQNRPAAALPDNINRNDHVSQGKTDEVDSIEHTDRNANKTCTVLNSKTRSVAQTISGSTKTNIIEVDNRSGYATVHTLDNDRIENNNNQRIRPPSPSGGTLYINTKAGEEPMQDLSNQQPIIKSSLLPFSNMLDKFRGVLASSGTKRSPPQSQTVQVKRNSTDSGVSMVKNLDDCGDYVTITDVRNNNKPSQCTPQPSETSEPARMDSDKVQEMEYVSLNELPVAKSSGSPPSSILSGSSNESSLERKRRQGARVTLDSEGKVVYSSDSLRRRKGAHTTFEPGPFVKDPSKTPTPSPVPSHRVPKAIIRPVNTQLERDTSPNRTPTGTPVKQLSQSAGPSAQLDCSIPITISNKSQINNSSLDRRSPVNRSRLSISPSHTTNRVQSPLTIIAGRQSISPYSNTKKRSEPPLLVSRAMSPTSTQQSKVIIRAGVSSPTKDLVRTSPATVVMPASRPMSPHQISSSRGAYVHMQSDGDAAITRTNLPFLQTDFDAPGQLHSSPASAEQENEGKKVIRTSTSTNRHSALTAGNGNQSLQDGDDHKGQKVKRSASYRMANFSPLTTVCSIEMDADKDQGGGDVDLGVADLGEPAAKPSMSSTINEEVCRIQNPNINGRRFYGAHVMVDPSLLQSFKSNRVTKPADTQRARVLSTAGYSAACGQFTRQPPKYISPPKVYPQPRYPPRVNNSFRHITPRPAFQSQPVYQNYPIPVQYQQPSQSSCPSPSFVAPPQLQQQAPAHVLKPATIPSVPKPSTDGKNSETYFLSSTPTKDDGRMASPLNMSNTFSPIEKSGPDLKQNSTLCSSPVTTLSKLKPSEFKLGDKRNIPLRKEVKSSLIAPPKSKMTSEELYAAIHKSKKRMNIKCEPEMALSPSPSISGSQSPVSSERSISPSCHPENIEARSRHSWSPNSSKYFDFYNHFEQRSSTPSPSKLAEPGLTQVTSRYDFKRLLLQHGSGTGGRSKLSAVERLKLAKQTATNAFSSNAAKLRLGLSGSNSSSTNSNSTNHSLASSGSATTSSNSPVPKPAPLLSPVSRTGPSKSGPRSVAAWRFASPRSDVLSSPIWEDHAEEEKAQEPMQIQKLSASPMPGRNLANPMTRRALSLQNKISEPEISDSLHSSASDRVQIRPVTLSIPSTVMENKSTEHPVPLVTSSNPILSHSLLQSPSQRMKALLAKQRSHYNETTIQSMLTPPSRGSASSKNNSPPALETAL